MYLSDGNIDVGLSFDRSWSVTSFDIAAMGVVGRGMGGGGRKVGVGAATIGGS